MVINRADLKLDGQPRWYPLRARPHHRAKRTIAVKGEICVAFGLPETESEETESDKMSLVKLISKLQIHVLRFVFRNCS